MSQVTITFKLLVKTTKKKDHYVAACPTLDVVSQGDTAETARDSLKEALRAFLGSCYERGVLEDVLKECGMILEKEGTLSELPPARLRRNYQHIDVPIPLIMAQRKQEDWHV